MTRILIGSCAFIGGWIGWVIGNLVGMMTAFFLSIIFSGIGMYVGRRISQEYLE